MSIGFIGCGNMGSALATAVHKSGTSANLFFANRTPEKARRLAAQLDGQAATNQQIAQHCHLIFLGVKPQMMADMLADIAPVLASRPNPPVLVTMAAGLTTARIQEMAGGSYPVIRTMPNTPASIGQGVLQYCGLDVSQQQLDEFATLLAPAGLVDAVPESLIDAASAVSGCGPAFCYLFMEALADGGVACGLPRDKALAYAAQTLQGAASLVLESGEHPGLLKDKVCSPGGSTIQGVRALEEGGFRSATMNAVITAFDKTKELGNK